MPIFLGICAVGVFAAGLLAVLAGWTSVTVAVHAALGVGALPLIAGAMLHFVPVLTRSAGAPAALARLPLVLQGAGVLALLFVAGQAGFGGLHAAAALAWGGCAVLALWIVLRVRRTLGAPHPGWSWYFMAVLCLLGGLAAIVAAYVWPLAFTGLRLAHVRLNLFGFVGLTALGTLHVLLPTVFGAPDPKTPSRLRQDLPLAFGGVLAVACAGLLPAPFDSGALLLGLTLYGVCVLKLAGAWWAAYGAKLWRDGVATLLVGALGGLCVVLMVQAGEVFWAWGYPWLIGHAVHTVHVPSVFVLAFLLPLVSGALSQLVPVWAHPGRVTPARLACRALLARYGQCRALAHAAAGVSLAVGATIPALLFSAVALALFLGNVGRAWHAGVLGWAAWRN